jgi:beta-1,4-mannosyltransferase
MARRATVSDSASVFRADPDGLPLAVAPEVAGPLVVLQSGGPPHARRNPYVTQLLASLPESVRPLYFSWRRALVGRYDVLHVHWPDAAIRGNTHIRSAARLALWVLILIRLRLQRRALVRTLHDLQPYDRPPLPERAVLRLFDRWTTLWITLSDRTMPPRPGPTAVVPHGHYRDWYADFPREKPVLGRVLHFGLIRRYKGTEALLAAFSQLRDENVTLRIVGHAQDRDVLASIERMCQQDSRISVVDQYLPDAQLAEEIGHSQLVVLPFDRVTNSGSLLLALSLGRPALVPATSLTEELAAEVGPGWVLTYRPPLDADALAEGLAMAPVTTSGAPPDLSGRDWPTNGALHAAAFTRARDIARDRSRGGHGLPTRRWRGRERH